MDSENGRLFYHSESSSFGRTLELVRRDTAADTYRVRFENGSEQELYDFEMDFAGEVGLPTSIESELREDGGSITVVDKINSDGGPSIYYDFPSGWVTLNDYIEDKCKTQWLGPESFHWGNVTKALCRWGDKEGTTKEYDTKKVIYSGVRVLMALVGPTKTRKYIQGLLDDPQFKEKKV